MDLKDLLKEIGKFQTDKPRPTGEQVKDTSLKTGLTITILGMLVGRYLEHTGVELSMEETFAVNSALAAMVMYGAAHWRVSRVATLSKRVMDGIEAKIQQELDEHLPVTDPPSFPGAPVNTVDELLRRARQESGA